MGKKAWLVTWEWIGDHARPEKPIAAIFKPQFSAARVRDLVEYLYLSTYTLGEQLEYALHPKQNPYKAEYGSIDGVKWTGEVTCGHNPWLKARLVDHLIIKRDEEGIEKALWKERAKPDVSWMKERAQ